MWPGRRAEGGGRSAIHTSSRLDCVSPLGMRPATKTASQPIKLNSRGVRRGERGIMEQSPQGARNSARGFPYGALLRRFFRLRYGRLCLSWHPPIRIWLIRLGQIWTLIWGRNPYSGRHPGRPILDLHQITPTTQDQKTRDDAPPYSQPIARPTIPRSADLCGFPLRGGAPALPPHFPTDAAAPV